ncbi:hypothetical protein TNIN_250281 [Trichonephila inaurata madagascariensis]|uniref:Ras-GEF domain-containing protein n=1 Tax=Trichonephila inaurata madagascariensis TaxID=2747483 RepID=A0A8X6Y5S8_9ARAC|nr:hypothetical protein TNIN_250281 [Trichonephila inaurata madagascariensis]
MDCAYHSRTVLPKAQGTNCFALHRNRQYPPPNAKRVHSEVAILSALSSAPIERLKGTWSRVPKSRRRTFRTLWELLCCPHETDMDTVTSKMEKVFSSEPFHQPSLSIISGGMA